MAEETYIVLGEQTQVFDAVLEVCDALHTQTESVTAIDLAVDTATLQYVRINHTATEDLHPACAFAETATCAAADVTRDIHLGTGFGEREVRRTQTNFCLPAEAFDPRAVPVVPERLGRETDNRKGSHARRAIRGA